LRSLDKTGKHPHIAKLQIKLAPSDIFQRQSFLNIKVGVTVRIDDAEVTSFECYQRNNELYESSEQSLRTCVVDFDVK